MNKEAKQKEIAEAVEHLSIPERKKVAGFIILLPIQYNALINDWVKKLNPSQLDEVLKFIETLPKDEE